MTVAAEFPAPDLPPVSFREALRFWWKLGWISFGGPAGQIATMHQELVERRRWISERRFLHALNYCMALPGPEAQQLATYVGWLLHGTKGGIAAGGLFILPSVFILMALSWAYMAYGQIAAVSGVLAGFKPAVVAVIVFACWKLGRRAIRSTLHAVLAIAALGALLLGTPFPLVVLGAAGAGLLAHFLGMPGAGAAASPHAIAVEAPPGVRYVIDDDTPTPPHARPSRARFLRTLGALLVLWCGVIGPLWVSRGASDPLVVMALFFSGAALITFGGAYAVLPYVAQVAIESHGWLTPHQMLDGLALGETTPGPLIMVVAFVGFVGSWQSVGPSLSWAGCLVATWFTFIPSFALILLGAPHIETLRGNLRWAAPLAAVSAAVVGVIAHLGVYLAAHVLAPGGSVDPFGIVLALLCGVVLFLKWLPVHWVVLAAGVVGLLRSVVLV